MSVSTAESYIKEIENLHFSGSPPRAFQAILSRIAEVSDLAGNLVALNAAIDCEAAALKVFELDAYGRAKRKLEELRRRNAQRNSAALCGND